MSPLKLVAFDDEDLQLLSAHLQDAILRVKDMAWEPGAKRFVALMNRFDWPHAQKPASHEAVAKADKKPYERRRCALRFDHVQSVQLKNISFDVPQPHLELLTIRFDFTDSPSGVIELVFAGDCSIRLNVECIEVELSDLGPGWKVRSRPEHEG